MNKLEATFRIVTPMFISGENQEQAELRVPSIKGALRYWYRAIDPEFKQHEGRIFGSSDCQYGQSCFLLRITDSNIQPGPKEDLRWDKTHTAYLGYGVIDRKETGETYRDREGNERKIKKQMTIRSYIKEGSTFKLLILFKPRHSTLSEDEYEKDVLRVKRALWALVMFGALGARSRKGFGSMVLTNISGMDDLPKLMPPDVKGLNKSLYQFLSSIPKVSGLPEYTCWSMDSRCLVVGSASSSIEMLEWLGETVHSYRSWRGGQKLKWVKHDHDLMRDFIDSGIPPPKPPRRAAFGLPHNYFFTSLGNRKGAVDLMDGDKKGRRASPLFFRIHEFINVRDACVVASFLPARLIPANKKIRISTDGRNIDIKMPNDFTAITDVLDKLKVTGQEIIW